MQMNSKQQKKVNKATYSIMIAYYNRLIKDGRIVLPVSP